MTTSARPQALGDHDAVVNITYKGQAGDLPDPVNIDSTDNMIKQFVAEALRGGNVPGIDPVTGFVDDDLADLVVERIAPHPPEYDFHRILVRPKTGFAF